MDIGDHCIYCGESTAWGSGRYVNRVPADITYRWPDGTINESVTWRTSEMDSPIPAGVRIDIEGYACAHCLEDECGLCGGPIALDEDWPHPDGFRTCLMCATAGNVREAMEAEGYDDEDVTEALVTLTELRTAMDMGRV